jgi:hypothetical protein
MGWDEELVLIGCGWEHSVNVFCQAVPGDRVPSDDRLNPSMALAFPRSKPPGGGFTWALFANRCQWPLTLCKTISLPGWDQYG